MIFNTGLDNTDLICVVSRGSKEILIYENASDKNAIGKIGGLINFAFLLNNLEEQ